ncbi:MAG: cation diffusion facilitator family transporter [Tissierellia bacterium]|nr:cation diffusion facilitator family transporter [Tissierellia bacterium]
MINYLYEKYRQKGDITDPKVRKNIGVKASSLGLILNLVLAIIKIIIGFFISSIAVLADGINNVFDTASSIVAIIGFTMAAKPADKDHPYGHGRIEYVSAMMISFLIVIIGISFLRTSYKRILAPKDLTYHPVALLLLIISIGVKYWFSRFNHYIGEKIQSKTLLANAYDSMGDVITTIVVLIPLITSRYTKIPIDGYIGLLVSLMIIKNGLTLMKESLSPLIGEAPPEDLLEDIKKTVLSYPHISCIHDIIYENRGGERALMTMNVEMPRDLTLGEAHISIDRAEREVLEKHRVLLVIHPDPMGKKSILEKKVKEKIKQALNSFVNIKSFYDFWIDEKSNNAYLDIEVQCKNPIDVDSFKKTVLDELEQVADYQWHLKVILVFS